MASSFPLWAEKQPSSTFRQSEASGHPRAVQTSEFIESPSLWIHQLFIEHLLRGGFVLDNKTETSTTAPPALKDPNIHGNSEIGATTAAGYSCCRSPEGPLTWTGRDSRWQLP